MKLNAGTVFEINIKKPRIRYLKHFGKGISRVMTENGFAYYNPDGTPVAEVETLQRIKALVIPPAWQDVWISPHENSHVQATGIDAKGRKQYRYHSDWVRKRSETKFSKLAQFARMVPHLRDTINERLKHRMITKEKVIAIVIDLMSKSYIRIGNSSYAKQNGSFGLTTLRDRHVDIHGDTLKLMFRGKKGVMQELEVHDKRLARLVKSCRDIPGHELFQYFDHEGNHHVIDSGDVNSFLHEVCGEDFSAKDFRTWAGTLHAFKHLTQMPVPKSERELKRITVGVIKEVSKVLGNTPAVCRKYYIHPRIFESFGAGELQRFYEKAIQRNKDRAIEQALEEELLVEFLEKLPD